MRRHQIEATRVMHLCHDRSGTGHHRGRLRPPPLLEVGIGLLQNADVHLVAGGKGLDGMVDGDHRQLGHGLGRDVIRHRPAGGARCIHVVIHAGCQRPGDLRVGVDECAAHVPDDVAH